MTKYFLVLLLFIPQFLMGSSGLFKPFTDKSFDTVMASYANEAFLVVLWSLDCPPCRNELKLLSRWKQQHPDLKMVFIATDSIELSDEAQKIIEEYGLEIADHWIFADTFVERLRHSIDPQWFGELPRSYFFDANHQATAHSGLLNAAILGEITHR